MVNVKQSGSCRENNLLRVSVIMFTLKFRIFSKADLLLEFLLVLIHTSLICGGKCLNLSPGRNIPYLCEQEVTHIYKWPNRNDHYESFTTTEEKDESRVFIS